MLIEHNEMSIGHTGMSIRPSDKQKCPLDFQMSIRPLGEQKCPVDIEMSIRPLDEQKCPVDIEMSIRPMHRWTNRHCLMANSLVFYPHGVMLNRITSL